MRAAISGSFMAAVMFYLVGAFITWEPNPANWNEAGRMVCALIWLVISGFFVMVDPSRP